MKALVLSSGGAKGAWQLGVLKKWMGESLKDYEIMTGVSVGALTIAGLSQFPFGQPKKAITNVIKLWEEHVDTSKIYRYLRPFGRIQALWSRSVYDSQPLVDLVNSNFDHKKTLNSGRRCAVGAVCLNDGEHRFVRETDPNFMNWVLASSSFPIFFKPVEIDGKLWSDGGIKNVTPIGQAIKMGATEIDVLVTNNPWLNSSWLSKNKRAIPDQIVRTLGLMNDKIMEDDIKITILKNELASIDNRYKRVKIRVVVPSEHLPDDSLDFSRGNILRMIDQGYNDSDVCIYYE